MSPPSLLTYKDQVRGWPERSHTRDNAWKCLKPPGLAWWSGQTCKNKPDVELHQRFPVKLRPRVKLLLNGNYQNFTDASGFVWVFRNKSHKVVSCPFVKNLREKFKFQFCKNNYRAEKNIRGLLMAGREKV